MHCLSPPLKNSNKNGARTYEVVVENSCRRAVSHYTQRNFIGIAATLVVEYRGNRDCRCYAAAIDFVLEKARYSDCRFGHTRCLFSPTDKKESEGLKCVALQHTLADASTLKGYDEVITVYDTAESIREKIEKLNELSTEATLQEPLTEREKEIIIGVVKGWTNKQIAEKLCLSAHTVITHRRNIAAKLQIHSAAGLTIYAIVNHFVDLNDVKGSIHKKEE